MPKKFIRRYLPNPLKVKDHKHLKIFGDWIHNPNLWHINRHSVAKAVTVAFFVSYIPLPGHMLLSTLIAIPFHANLLIAIALVWIANPLTMGPMYYFAYEVGVHLLQLPHEAFHFELTLHWFIREFEHIALPLFVGGILCGAVLALFGNIATRVIWRIAITRAWKKRTKNRLLHEPSTQA